MNTLFKAHNIYYTIVEMMMELVIPALQHVIIALQGGCGKGGVVKGVQRHAIIKI